MTGTIGAAIIMAANRLIAAVATVVAPNAFVAPFAVTSGTILGISAPVFVGTVAVTALSAALLPSPPSPASSKVAVRNPVGPRRVHYGRVRVSGNLAELKVSEVLEDGVLYSATMLMTRELDAIETHFINDQEARVDAEGKVTYPVQWYDNQRVQLNTHAGTASQTADASLIAAFPGRWTDKHRLDGIAYVAGRFNGAPLEVFADIYQAGLPNYSGVIRAAKVWDPRVATQSATDPSTWAWSENAALIIMDYLWHRDGMRLDRDLIELALDDWRAKADACDVQQALLGGGTEARYRLAGGYELVEAPKDVLKRMLTPIDGRLRLREDGAIVLDIGEFETPTEHETFSQADIIGFELKRGPAKSELRNEIRASYTSAAHNYQPQEADPWRDEASIDLYGEQSAVLDLSWCTSHRQARQRMKVEAARQNPEWVGTIVTNARGLNLSGKRYARFVIADLGLDETFYIVKGNIDLLASGACTFEVVSFPSSVYDWTVAEEGVSPEHQRPGNHGVAVPSGTTSVTITADGAGGGGSGNDGGGGGARCIKTMAIVPADWGKVILFTVGRGGLGDPPDLALSTNGGASTVTGSLAAGAIAMSAGGGTRGIEHAGGIATGGDTNTNGSGASGGDGGTAASGAIENEAPGGGGHEATDGGHGRVTFDWVY